MDKGLNQMIDINAAAATLKDPKVTVPWVLARSCLGQEDQHNPDQL